MWDDMIPNLMQIWIHPDTRSPIRILPRFHNPHPIKLEIFLKIIPLAWGNVGNMICFGYFDKGIEIPWNIIVIKIFIQEFFIGNLVIIDEMVVDNRGIEFHYELLMIQFFLL